MCMLANGRNEQGSLVLVRYLKAYPGMIPGGRSGPRPAQILEIGAGLGAGGLGVAVLARHLRRFAQVNITDCDPNAVDVIESSITCNALAPALGAQKVLSTAHQGCDDPVPTQSESESAGKNKDGETSFDRVECRASVFDWDQIASYKERYGDMKYDMILGAEVVHELSHAAGVHRAISDLLAPDGVAIMVCGAAKHRFGVVEFQDMLRNDKLLVHTVEEVPRCLTHDMESLQDDMLGLQVYTIKWAEASSHKAGILPPPIKELSI